MPNNKQITGGLRKLKGDIRDFNLGAIQKPIDVSGIPDFIVGEPIQKDQGNTDFCSAFATTSASELQEGVELNPFWQFAKTKEILGNWKEWGADLRTACKSLVDYGSLEETQVQGLEIINESRDIIANWQMWPGELDIYALTHKKQSYFAITKGAYSSIFEAIKAALWQNKDEKRIAIVGALWKGEWTDAENGIIPEVYGDNGTGHAFVFKGFKHINGVPYLVAHLSNGDIGDTANHAFYFSESVVNREIGDYGIYMYVDFDPKIYEQKYWSLWQKIINILKVFF